MVSTEAKMTTARVCVVLSTVAAALGIAAIMRLPLYELRMDSINSSITQSLFTTDIYTPVAEKHIPVRRFTEKCERLQTAFRVAQIGAIAAAALLALAFVCGLLHLAPSFTKTNHRVRRVCGVPICVLLLLTAVALGMDAYIVKALYEKDTWCKQPESITSVFAPPNWPGQTTEEGEAPAAAATVFFVVDPPRVVAQPAVLREERRVFATPARWRMEFPAGAIPARPVSPLAHTAADDAAVAKRCNPFEDCISAYREMGFERAVGYNVVWAALWISVFALVVEMMVMAVGASVVPQAGVAAETVSLLQRQDDDRVI
ncbi:hypothetical protein ABB37_09014 [Leptomonas pyrrhocoris]|uniref:Uncharacterized protein n=1 Tax=Leptomonas pyrrhocoris TaxID=157538 RepID=A0A0M9FRQ2_LEPPY|nr:hypothetical protein ABB37_09014 [Leptomonas pyrrhocoris]XP_015653131.1 hypothetical protein ABB37_09014 [Leptomonas pyrrhocoris]XP_015653132.1 hypothetical protein ABB37_09014 [Leptomonas pyrrhocoris]XP_015653133.1 hypothetical protein ABB37_09014 [Leptomonas pyrrhocoris]XP_015653134.1 hypothetical protein ABB37_09014 [Leptomonas pyrrhocoris]KPA74691.1 hypothetical protein ABB37_09014 [Leptomonas pyrrhocoris]KPA74692.1 hypothetical protein ABB37_09014 [Leptomonas pyrrhocoris]KPA74693.1 h|eukprot:XP_015653130.1 hypothetical protein ABB37_09014 [Leptomonas pyrrhocoris]